MRNPERIKPLLKAIEKKWKQYPDLRLGQLLFNALGVGGQIDMFNITDKAFMNAFEVDLPEYIQPNPWSGISAAAAVFYAKDLKEQQANEDA